MRVQRWNAGHWECELVGADGTGRAGWDLGAGSTHLGASQITLGKSLPSVFNVLTHVPRDTAVAILSEARDLCRTVDLSFSYLALRLLIFGMELWLQGAGSVLLWLHTINTCHGIHPMRDSPYKYRT